jgi:hypothetical protein
MRPVLGVMLLALSQTVIADVDVKEKWSAGYGEKTRGLKVKSVKHDKPRGEVKGYDEYRVVIEFGRDLKPEEITVLRDCILPTMRFGGAKLEFQFFDDDGVVMSRCSNYKIEGELTGAKGDAFRAVVPAPPKGSGATITKVEMRLPSRYLNPPGK